MSFAAGDRVAWDHAYATQHGEGSIILAEAAAAQAPGVRFGTVQDVANQEGTWFSVQLDGESELRVLTGDEIVKVTGDAPAPVEAAPAEAAPEPEPAPEPAPEAPAE